MRSVNKEISFPMAGVARHRNYRKQTSPYSCPWAANVRGIAQIENRERGGSRPGLSKAVATDLGSNITAMIPITSIDASGNRDYYLVVIADGTFYTIEGSAIAANSPYLLDDDGSPVLTEDGDYITFDSTVSASNPVGSTGAYHAAVREGKVLLADSVLRQYDPQTTIVEAVVASVGTIPTSQPLVCVYRDRVVLCGLNHLFYISRQSDITDWEFGADIDDGGRAVAGHLAYAGLIGEIPTSVINVQDQALVFGSHNELWVIKGDPATGVARRVSSEIGIISQEAWAINEKGTMAFLSNDGIYLWNAGSEAHPERLSDRRVPAELKDISVTANHIVMGYDPREKGFHLFITPTGATTGSHWWIDLDNKALWPVYLQQAHQPHCVARVNSTTGMADVMLGCKDGYVRKFYEDNVNDDGTAIESHILLGPFRISSGDSKDAMLAEVHGILADLPSGAAVTWRIIAENSAERAADVGKTGIEADIAGTAITGIKASGTWSELRNKVVRPRVRGAWICLWLTSTDQWAYETIEIIARQLGRLR